MRKLPSNIVAKLFYSVLILMTGAAIATPSASAANMPFETNTGALLLIVPVAILLTTLVVEVWRETGHQAHPMITEQLRQARQSRLGR